MTVFVRIRICYETMLVFILRYGLQGVLTAAAAAYYYYFYSFSSLHGIEKVVHFSYL
jgi:hypothetical protein